MKLYKEVCPIDERTFPRRYMLIQGVTDDDTLILQLCNWERRPELDDKEHDAEAWMVM